MFWPSTPRPLSNSQGGHLVPPHPAPDCAGAEGAEWGSRAQIWHESFLVDVFSLTCSCCIISKGLAEEGKEETLLGTFTYNVQKEPTQTFPLQVQ